MTAIAVFTCHSSSHPFQERKIPLKEPVKIGRSVAKARPTVENGIFDCKVLSRNHALIWYDQDTLKVRLNFWIYIKMFLFLSWVPIGIFLPLPVPRFVVIYTASPPGYIPWHLHSVLRRSRRRFTVQSCSHWTLRGPDNLLSFCLLFLH